MTESVAPNEESELNLQVKARKLVREYYNTRVAPIDIEDYPKVTLSQVYVVWFAKVLGNWKALLGTVNSDGLYFEVTYDGNKNQTYLDHYEKQMNVEYKHADAANESISQDRAERAEHREEMHKAAIFAVKRLEAAGFGVSGIAEQLNISESTVRTLLISGKNAHLS